MKEPVKDMKWAKYPTGDITQYFGENKKLYEPAGLVGHNGIDIVRPWGEHIFAVEGGTVVSVEDDPGYGKAIRILSPTGKSGEYRDWAYGHLSYIHVKEGDVMRPGQYIGNMGNTGFVVSNATGNGFWKYNPYAGTHLHLGVRDVVKSPTGWKYNENAPRVKVVNINNGFKGRYDPLPLFVNTGRVSSLVRALSDGTTEEKEGHLSKEVLYKMFEILKKIGL